MTLLEKAVAPNVELVFHLAEEIGPVTLPERMDNCLRSRSGVRCLRRLPREKTSLLTWTISFRPRSWQTNHEK